MSNAISTYAKERADLIRWLEQTIRDGATRLVLRQKTEDGAEHVVREFGCTTEVAELAERIDRRAHDEGRHFRGRALYGVFSYREREYVDRHFFTVEGGEEDVGFSAREAHMSGVVAQLMRHNEASARLAIGQTLDVIGHYKALLAAREKRVEELEAKYSQTAELYERLASLQHERELEVMKQKSAERRDDFLREKLDALAPVLLAKVLPGAKQNAALGEELIRQFLGSLSPEQLQAILGLLRPEQGAVISQVYATYAERDLAREEAKKTNGASGKSQETR